MHAVDHSILLALGTMMMKSKKKINDALLRRCWILQSIVVAHSKIIFAGLEKLSR